MRLVLPIRPMPASRPRVSTHGTYYPARYADWLGSCALLARLARGSQPTLEGAVRVDVRFEPEQIVVDVGGSTGSRGKVRGDLDNHLKSVLDALTRAGVWQDDRQIVTITASIVG